MKLMMKIHCNMDLQEKNNDVHHLDVLDVQHVANKQ